MRKDYLWYYDWTPDRRYSHDPEGSLAWLCSECAAQAGDAVQLAGSDEYAQDIGPCWNCGHARGDTCHPPGVTNDTMRSIGFRL